MGLFLSALEFNRNRKIMISIKWEGEVRSEKHRIAALPALLEGKEKTVLCSGIRIPYLNIEVQSPFTVPLRYSTVLYVRAWGNKVCDV